RAVLAHEGTQDPELGRDRPRFQGRPLTQQAEHLIAGRAGAAPLVARGGFQGGRQGRRRRAGVPLTVVGEAREQVITGGVDGRSGAGGSAGSLVAARQIGVRAGLLALPVVPARLPSHGAPVRPRIRRSETIDLLLEYYSDFLIVGD